MCEAEWVDMRSHFTLLFMKQIQIQEGRNHHASKCISQFSAYYLFIFRSTEKIVVNVWESDSAWWKLRETKVKWSWLEFLTCFTVSQYLSLWGSSFAVVSMYHLRNGKIMTRICMLKILRWCLLHPLSNAVHFLHKCPLVINLTQCCLQREILINSELHKYSSRSNNSNNTTAKCSGTSFVEWWCSSSRGTKMEVNIALNILNVWYNIQVRKSSQNILQDWWDFILISI